MGKILRGLSLNMLAIEVDQTTFKIDPILRVIWHTFVSLSLLREGMADGFSCLLTI